MGAFAGPPNGVYLDAFAGINSSGCPSSDLLDVTRRLFDSSCILRIFKSLDLIWVDAKGQMSAGDTCKSSSICPWQTLPRPVPSRIYSSSNILDQQIHESN